MSYCSSWFHYAANISVSVCYLITYFTWEVIPSLKFYTGYSILYYLILETFKCDVQRYAYISDRFNDKRNQWDIWISTSPKNTHVPCFQNDNTGQLVIYIIYICLPVIRSGTKDLARHCEGSKKKGETKGRGGKTTSESGQDWTFPSHRGLWKTDRQTRRQLVSEFSDSFGA